MQIKQPCATPKRQAQETPSNATISETIMRQQSKQGNDKIMFLSSWTPPLQTVHYPEFYAFCPVRLREQSPDQSGQQESGTSEDLVACWYLDLIDQNPIRGRSWTATVEGRRKQSDWILLLLAYALLFCVEVPGGGGLANGFGGPCAPALRIAPAEGDGGGKTTPE